MSVALHSYVRRRIRAGMSPFTSSSSDMPGLECRASRGSGATCSPWYVAPHELVERHARAGMSRLVRIRSDMLALVCRSACVRSATWIGLQCLWSARARRHSRSCWSRRARGSGDMPRPHGRRARERQVACPGDVIAKKGRSRWCNCGSPAITASLPTTAPVYRRAAWRSPSLPSERRCGRTQL
jgi:hypothetical protein